MFLARGTEDRGDILRGLAHPHGFELGVADDQKLAAEGMGDGLGADGLAGAWRPSEVEGETKAG